MNYKNIQNNILYSILMAESIVHVVNDFCRLGMKGLASRKERSSFDRLGNPLVTFLDTLVSRIITFAHLDSEHELPSVECMIIRGRSMVEAEEEATGCEIESKRVDVDWIDLNGRCKGLGTRLRFSKRVQPRVCTALVQPSRATALVQPSLA